MIMVDYMIFSSSEHRYSVTSRRDSKRTRRLVRRASLYLNTCEIFRSSVTIFKCANKSIIIPICEIAVSEEVRERTGAVDRCHGGVEESLDQAALAKYVDVYRSDVIGPSSLIRFDHHLLTLHHLQLTPAQPSITPAHRHSRELRAATLTL